MMILETVLLLQYDVAAMQQCIVPLKSETFIFHFQVLDCPGLFDTGMPHEQICTVVVKAVTGMHPGPHAMLYVVRIGRYTQEEHGAYRRLKALFDDKVSNHMILLFTSGDSLGHVRGAQARDEIARRIMEKGPKELQEVFSECGQRAVVFDNMASDKPSQVQYLLQEIRSMVARNGGQPYVCPKYDSIGKSLEEEVNRRVQKIEMEDAKRQKYVQQLEREKKSAEENVQKTTELIQRKEDEWERKEKEQAQQKKKMEQEFQSMMKQQADQANKQQERLMEVMKEREEADRIMREREHEMNEREKQRMREEMADRQAEQARVQTLVNTMQQTMEQQRREFEQKMAMQQQQHDMEVQRREEERERRLRELQIQQQEAEERRERQRQQERKDEERRERLRREQMESMKQGVVEEKEPGFLSKVGNVVMKGVRFVGKLFGF
jgi:hypothetical protein